MLNHFWRNEICGWMCVSVGGVEGPAAFTVPNRLTRGKMFVSRRNFTGAGCKI